ncbi:VIT domain-containing protein [Methanococcoides sp. NM1]|uniref:VIT domain-containing protein n=1 Tax=Methanococcoides sp. NM1 TaxID=1201013 RepID=UPI0010830EE5|nr:VIT domain-containing protein [Methanococcoides sp. NM1]
MKIGSIKQICLPIIILFLIFLAASPATSAQPLVVDYMDIDVDINNGYVITTVEEKLTNQMDDAVFDDFSIFLPEEAFISGFSIIIDGEEYKSSVLPKEEASEKFEEATSEGKTAGLLETEDRNRFAYALSFEPHQSIVVRLTYEQALKKALGEYEYTQFLRSDHDVNNLSVNISISSVNKILSLDTPGFTGANVEYLSITDGQVTYNADSLPDSDLTVVFTTNNPPLTGDILFYEIDDQGYMMHVFSPTEEDLGTTALSKDIIFVIDKSGSMRGVKIDQVKRVFTNIIYGLPSNDRFNVIFFDGYVHTYSNQLMQVNSSTKKKSIEFVNELDADGSTNINDALVTALRMFENESENVPIIVFLTDGEPTAGVTSPYMIRENIKETNTAEVSIFTIAFGIDQESYYDFLKGMSLENYGKAERFYLADDSEEGIGDFYQTISTPLITDMKFTYSGQVLEKNGKSSYNGQVSEIVNTGKNNLFAGSDAIVLGKYRPGTHTVTSMVEATTRTGKQDFTGQVTVISKEENAFIPRLWAYTTINDLMNRIEVEGETEELVSSVTDLSLEFGFVTPYTSLFVEIPDATTTDEVEKMVSDEMEPVDEACVEAEIPTEEVDSEAAEEALPGFEIIYSIVGMMAVACLLLRRRN